jgi:threonine dehydrogenase-like Zn-dependent dehydrogenase
VKQIIQSYKTGELRVADVAPPALRAGSLLIRTHYSLISAGTERAMVELAQKSLLGKARARPDLVRKVLNKARRDGWLNAYQAAMRRLDNWVPLGYSAAGRVREVGEGITGFGVGDAVACAGIGFASHAEQMVVPRNLCVPIPAGVGFAEAAYVALGSIALHGLRISDIQLGERVAVIGLGLVGQLAFRLLSAAGCQVFGIDVQANQVDHALAHGIDAACLRSADNLETLVERFTGGLGFDAVFITAASSSSDPMDLAGEVAELSWWGESRRSFPEMLTTRRNCKCSCPGPTALGAMIPPMKSRVWIILPLTCAGPKTGICPPFWSSSPVRPLIFET